MSGTLPEDTLEEALAWVERGTAPFLVLNFGARDSAIWVLLTRTDRDNVRVAATGKECPRAQASAALPPVIETATALDVRFRQRIPDDLTRLHLWLLMIGANNLGLTLDGGITVWKELGAAGCTYFATRTDERTDRHATPHAAVEELMAYGSE
jgi:hypothetical protein